MTMRLKPLWGDERGGVLLETTIMLTILLIFILGSVDFLMAMYQWNAAGKAVQIGARIAAVSTPVATGFTLITGLEGGASPGDYPPPAFTTRTCTGAGGGSCTGGGTYDATAMNRIVFGRTGGTSCTDATSPYEIGMCDVFSRVTAANVSVSYIYSGLGFAGRPGGPVPTVAVSLQNLTFQFIFLSAVGFSNVTIPPLTTTITGEDLSSAAPS
jgi:TadE-like protein